MVPELRALLAIQAFRQVPRRPHGGAVWLCFARTISACLPSNQILPQTDHPSWWEGVAPHHRLYRLFKISIPRLYSTTRRHTAVCLAGVPAHQDPKCKHVYKVRCLRSQARSHTASAPAVRPEAELGAGGAPDCSAHRSQLFPAPATLCTCSSSMAPRGSLAHF